MIINVKGIRYGRLVVEEFYSIDGVSRMARWICICDCGNRIQTSGKNLRSGDTKSCGCLNTETRIKRFYKHGLSRHPISVAYHSMLDRCSGYTEKNIRNYKNRGITVCDEWRKDKSSFLRWAITRWKKGLSLDRIDNDGGYSPSNCRFTTNRIQCGNKRTNFIVRANGEDVCLTELIRKNGNKITYSGARYRIKKGISPMLAVTMPANYFPIVFKVDNS